MILEFCEKLRNTTNDIYVKNTTNFNTHDKEN